MRQTLCDGYLVIFALAQAVILLLLTPLFTGISRQIRARMHSRRGPGIWQDYRDIHKLFKRQEVAPTSSGLMFRLMPWVLISSMLVLSMALPLFIAVSPFAGGGDRSHHLKLGVSGRHLRSAFIAGSCMEVHHYLYCWCRFWSVRYRAGIRQRRQRYAAGRNGDILERGS